MNQENSALFGLFIITKKAVDIATQLLDETGLI